jgi:hypothetical protein
VFSTLRQIGGSIFRQKKMSADEKTSLTSMDDVMIFRQFDKSEETRRFDVKRKFKFKKL